MGIFSFLKKAGAAMAGTDAPTKTAAPELTDEQKAEALQNMLTRNGLHVDGLCLQVEGERVKVEGEVESQEVREKVILALGNVQGIAEVEDQLSVKQPEPEAQFYTVQKGDSLSKIAKKFYGDAMKYPVIFEANRPLLSDPDKIYPGQVLRIPPLNN